MEKRRLISLHAVLLRYLAVSVLVCVLTVVVWLVGFMLLVLHSGWFLPANYGARASQQAAQEILPEMTAASFDPARLDPICRYALFAAQGGELLATNMDDGHLEKAMKEWQGSSSREVFYLQYYTRAALQDGAVCLLQYDYAVAYADPVLRSWLPDVQLMHLCLGVVLLVGAVTLCTRRTGKFLARETVRLTEAARKVAAQELEDAVFEGAQVKEYDAALRALQGMGNQLTESLQRQWELEHRQRQQIIRLAHELKNPLSVVQGNAELLAEDDLTEEQKEQVAAILAGAEQTRTYLLRIRAEVQTPLRFKK